MKNLISVIGMFTFVAGLFIMITAGAAYLEFSFIKDIWDLNFTLWGVAFLGLLIVVAGRYTPWENFRFSGKVVGLLLIIGGSILYISFVEAIIYGYNNRQLEDRGYLLATPFVVAIALFVTQRARGVKVF